MTLNEYITQSEPQANVKVILKEGEYIQRNAIKVTPFSVQTTVDIPVVTQRYGIKDNYIRIGSCLHDIPKRANCAEACFSCPTMPRNRPYFLNSCNS